jgi:hypothetical protein
VLYAEKQLEAGAGSEPHTAGLERWRGFSFARKIWPQYFPEWASVAGILRPDSRARLGV